MDKKFALFLSIIPVLSLTSCTKVYFNREKVENFFTDFLSSVGLERIENNSDITLNETADSGYISLYPKQGHSYDEYEDSCINYKLDDEDSKTITYGDTCSGTTNYYYNVDELMSYYHDELSCEHYSVSESSWKEYNEYPYDDWFFYDEQTSSYICYNQENNNGEAISQYASIRRTTPEIDNEHEFKSYSNYYMFEKYAGLLYEPNLAILITTGDCEYVSGEIASSSRKLILKNDSNFTLSFSWEVEDYLYKRQTNDDNFVVNGMLSCEFAISDNICTTAMYDIDFTIKYTTYYSESTKVEYEYNKSSCISTFDTNMSGMKTLPEDWRNYLDEE